MLTAGDSLPTIAVPDDTGHTVDLGSYAGRALVVFFYPKADTPG